MRLLLFCCDLHFSFFFFVKSVFLYLQKKRIENLANNIDQLLDERFLLKIKNELRKIHKKQLYTD